MDLKESEKKGILKIREKIVNSRKRTDSGGGI